MKRLLIMMAVFWQVMNVSAYCETGNRTASGVWPAVGHCAVDKINGQWIPFGTRITTEDGRVLTVTDRFGGNYDNRLDIFMASEDECWKFGRQFLRCRIETPQ